MFRQQVGGIDGVARKSDVAEHKLMPLVNLDSYHQPVLPGIVLVCLTADQIYRVPHNAGIAETVLIIVGDDALQILAILGLLILGCFPEPRSPEIELLEIIHVMRVLHQLHQFVGTDVVVPLKDNRVNLHALAGFDVENHIHAVLLPLVHNGVRLGCGGDGHIGIALLQIIGADFVTRSGQQVLRHHIARGNLHLFAQLFLVAALHTAEFEHAQLGAAAQLYLKENLVALNTCHIDLHILEQALLPQAVHRRGQLVARHTDLVAHLQPRNQQNHTGVVVLGTLKRDAPNLIGLGRKVVDVVLMVAHNNLGGGGSTEAEHSEQRQQ